MTNSLGEALAYYQENGMTPEMLMERQLKFENRRNKGEYIHEPTAAGLKYIERQREYARNSTATHLSIQLPKVTFKEAKTTFWEIINKKLSVDGLAFSKEGNVSEVVPELIRYFIGDTLCIYPLNKGIYLWGDTGIGKTFLMEIMREMLKQMDLPQQVFTIYNAQNIAENVLTNEKFDPSGYVNGSSIFDDFGQETPIIKLFSNDVKPMSTIVNRAYDNFKSMRRKTHFTSMLPPELLLGKFEKGVPQIDRRTYERIFEMTTSVKLTGKSKRNIPAFPQY